MPSPNGSRNAWKKSKPRCPPTSKSTAVYDRTRLVDQVIATGLQQPVRRAAVGHGHTCSIFLGNLRGRL